MKKVVIILCLIFSLSGCTIVSKNVPNKTGDSVAKIPSDNKSVEVVEPEEVKVKIMAVGDIMTSRTVGQKMLKHGYDYPFLKTGSLLSEADLTFGNLETAITPGKVVTTGEMMFRSDPEVAKTLKDVGFDIVSLANNHTPNYGQKGLLDTYKLLDEQKVEYIGAGKDLAEARQLKITEVKGVKIGWLAYNADDVVPTNYQASDKRAGTVFMDVESMKKDVLSAKKQVDLVFVSMHAGTEYTAIPNKMQSDFARSAIDAGADLIIGHHPHVVQHLEKYKNKFIIYSLGNFVFDQMWSEPTRRGLAVEITANKNKVEQLRFIPVIIDDYSQPRPALDPEAKVIIKSLNYDLDKDLVAN